jgi:hypothetical protein
MYLSNKALGEFIRTEIRLLLKHLSARREPFAPDPGNSGVGKRLAGCIFIQPPDVYVRAVFLFVRDGF